jgi:hypothetical protein
MKLRFMKRATTAFIDIRGYLALHSIIDWQRDGYFTLSSVH